MTVALLARLTHKAHITEFLGESYRFRKQQNRKGYFLSRKPEVRYQWACQGIVTKGSEDWGTEILETLAQFGGTF